jgi:hypothetical protein
MVRENNLHLTIKCVILAGYQSIFNRSHLKKISSFVLPLVTVLTVQLIFSCSDNFITTP